MNHIEPSEEPSSIMSDTSFVILGHGSFLSDDIQQSIKPEEVNPRLSVNGMDKTLTSSVISNGVVENNSNNLEQASWESDNSEDIHKKLDCLLRENCQLKETLSQNNIAMKQQFETIVKWQEEVFKTHQDHKEKFAQTKQLVIQLKADNSKLKLQVESYEKNQLNSSDNNLIEVNVNLKKINEELQQKVLSHAREEGELKRKAQELHELCQNLLEKLEISEKSNRRLKMEEESLVIQLRKLKEEQTESRRHSMQQPTKELLSEKLIALNSSESDSMTGWHNYSVDSILQVANVAKNNPFGEQLKSEITVLREQLIAEQNNSAEYKKVLASYQQQIRDLHANYQDLSQKCNRRSTSMERSHEQSYIETVEALNRQLKAKDEMLQLKEGDAQLLLKGMEKMKLQCEQVEVLEAQVETYKTDFELERESKEKQVSEKEAMAEELRKVVQVNKSLRDEVETLNDRLKDTMKQGANVQGKQTNSKGKSPTAPTSPPVKTATEATTLPSPSNKKSTYFCPVCQKRFAVLEDCEVHAFDCVDDDWWKF